jgi:glycosyltransferase involved in cell wall biosynthesis
VSRAVAASAAASVRDPAMLRVVHDGVDVARYPGVRAGALRRALGVPPDAPLVGQVAALAPDKDPLGFVEAAARVRARGARFALVGEGRLGGQARERVRALGVGDRVAFAGFRGDVPAILPDLDVLVVARDEGLGSIVLEAFASGVPVVATDLGGVPELVRDGETGLLVPASDPGAIAAAVDRLLADPALRGRVAAGGREVARSRSAERLAAETAAVYAELLDPAAAARAAAGVAKSRPFG